MIDTRSTVGGKPNPNYAVPNSACQMRVKFSKRQRHPTLYGFVMTDPYLGTGACMRYPRLPTRIMTSTKVARNPPSNPTLTPPLLGSWSRCGPWTQ